MTFVFFVLGLIAGFAMGAEYIRHRWSTARSIRIRAQMDSDDVPRRLPQFPV